MYTLERNLNKLFEDYYDRFGNKYLFIYRCNHNVTNIQYRELLELLRRHCTFKGESFRVTFSTRSQMENYFDEFEVELFSEDVYGGPLIAACKERLERTIVIENYYTSSIVYVPSNIYIDIIGIVAEAGYIHSVGELALSTEMTSASLAYIKLKILQYAEHLNTQLKIRVFSKENYAIESKGYVDDFEDNGLANIRLDLKHYYFSVTPLVYAIEELNNSIEQLHIENSESINNIIWVTQDQSVRTINDDYQKYYFFSRTISINRNICYLFDTDHPAWNNTLIPHSLVGAMYNICKNTSLDNDQNTIALDPLVGSGTMAVEAAKYQDVDFYGYDVSCDSSEKVEYNLEFFSMDYKRTLSLCITIYGVLEACYKDESKLIMKHLSSYRKEQNEKIGEYYRKQEDKVIERLVLEVKSVVDSRLYLTKHYPMYTDDISSDYTYIRKFFYFFFEKVDDKISSYPVKIEDDTTVMKHILITELSEMYYRILDMLSVLYHQENSFIERKDNSIITFEMEGMMGVCFDYMSLNRESSRENIQSKIDICTDSSRLPYINNGINLVITDPPYGYNTNENKEKLFSLYVSMISTSLDYMKSGGQLIISLPSKMHCGKQFYSFIKSQYVSELVYRISEEYGLKLVNTDQELMNLDAIYRFPFYWESKKVLRREIIRFQFYAPQHIF